MTFLHRFQAWKITKEKFSLTCLVSLCASCLMSSAVERNLHRCTSKNINFQTFFFFFSLATFHFNLMRKSIFLPVCAAHNSNAGEIREGKISSSVRLTRIQLAVRRCGWGRCRRSLRWKVLLTRGSGRLWKIYENFWVFVSFLMDYSKDLQILGRLKPLISLDIFLIFLSLCWKLEKNKLEGSKNQLEYLNS